MKEVHDNQSMEQLKQSVASARLQLLTIHKHLLQQERARYEAKHGPLQPSKLLELLMTHTDFAWLRSISILVTQIDEVLEDKTKQPGTTDLKNMLASMRALVTGGTTNSEFTEKYNAALKRDAELVIEHEKLLALVQD